MSGGPTLDAFIPSCVRIDIVGRAIAIDLLTGQIIT